MRKAKDLPLIAGKVYSLLKELNTEERQKVISAVIVLFGDPIAHGSSQSGTGGQGGQPAGGRLAHSLASYLSLKQASGNQTKRFLATADWLRQKGATELSSGLVSKALRDSHQAKLGNPADCLNKNAAKGLVEKNGKTFFITPEGLAALGHIS